MKRECKDCLHYGMSDDGDWYCRKHREHVQFISCDDFWPKDSNPRCDECRFAVMHDAMKRIGVEIDTVMCFHSSHTHERNQDFSIKTDSSFCENWRARG